jgi:hypothetical protein
MIWAIAWFAWIIMFGIIEAIAIKHDAPGDTLTEHIQKWFRTDTHLGRTAFLVAFGGFAVWFVIHILTWTFS